MNEKKLKIHIGNIISDVMKNKKVSKAELSRRLGVKPQSVDYLLNRQSIDTHMLYNVSNALDYDFAKFFSIEKKQTNSEQVNSDYALRKAKILLEVELDTEDVIKLNLKDRVIKILNE
jgi:transcriptional regulator with XRE-family HTH domain